MYGTIARVRPKPGREQAVRQLSERWLRQHAAGTDSFVAAYLLASETHPGEWLSLIIYDSKASYRTNADDPAQHRWYEEYRALLAADPELNDGEVVLLEPESVPL